MPHARSCISDSPSLRADHSGVSLLFRELKTGCAQAQCSAGDVDAAAAKLRAFHASSQLKAVSIRLDEGLTARPSLLSRCKGFVHMYRLQVSKGQRRLQVILQGGHPKVQGWPNHPCCEANKVVAAAAQADGAAAPVGQLQVHPQCTSVAIDLSELLHQHEVTMLNGRIPPLTATEAQAFNDIVEKLGFSHGGI